MHKKTILITLCCASLILVTPFTTVAQENTVSNNLSEQPNDVEGLVAQIRVVIDEILEKYWQITMVSSLRNMILNTLDMLGNIIICIFLNILIFLLVQLHRFIYIFSGYLNANIIWICIIIINFGYNFNCRWFFSYKSFKLPFQTIYTMLETKDNINTFDGCPCLRE